jgi:integrase
MARRSFRTDAFFQSLTPVPGKQVEFPDDRVHGLALRVSSKGKKTWTFRYRNEDRRQRRLTFGPYPAVTLDQARRKANEAVGQVADQVDPAREKREARARRGARTVNTVGELIEDYFAASKLGQHKPNGRPKRQRTLDDEQSYYTRLIKPRFGQLPVAELQRADLQRFLDGIAKAAPGTARLCRNVLRQAYNYGLRREIVAKNPAQFGEVPAWKDRERVLSDKELRTIWKTCEAPEGVKALTLSIGMSLAIRFAMVTLQRGTEVTGLDARELDLEAKTWTIPSTRTKNHKVHVVPLSDMALTLLREAIGSEATRKGRRTQTGRAIPEFAFPSPNGNGPITRRAFTRAVSRIAEGTGIEDAVPHDFRRTGSTHLTGEHVGVPRFIVSRVLNHVSDTGGAATVTGVYDRNEYLAEKRNALARWAARLDEIVTGKKPASNIVRIGSKRRTRA